MNKEEIKKSIARANDIINDSDSMPEMVDAAKAKVARLEKELESASEPQAKVRKLKAKKVRYKNQEEKKKALENMLEGQRKKSGSKKKNAEHSAEEKELFEELERCKKLIRSSKPQRRAAPVAKGTEESLEDLTEKIFNLVKRKKGNDEKILRLAKKLIVSFEIAMKQKVFGLKHTKPAKAIIDKADTAIDKAEAA